MMLTLFHNPKAKTFFYYELTCKEKFQDAAISVEDAIKNPVKLRPHVYGESGKFHAQVQDIIRREGSSTKY